MYEYNGTRFSELLCIIDCAKGRGLQTKLMWVLGKALVVSVHQCLGGQPGFGQESISARMRMGKTEQLAAHWSSYGGQGPLKAQRRVYRTKSQSLPTPHSTLRESFSTAPLCRYLIVTHTSVRMRCRRFSLSKPVSRCEQEGACKTCSGSATSHRSAGRVLLRAQRSKVKL